MQQLYMYIMYMVIYIPSFDYLSTAKYIIIAHSYEDVSALTTCWDITPLTLAY